MYALYSTILDCCCSENYSKAIERSSVVFMYASTGLERFIYRSKKCIQEGRWDSTKVFLIFIYIVFPKVDRMNGPLKSFINVVKSVFQLFVVLFIDVTKTRIIKWWNVEHLCDHNCSNKCIIKPLVLTFILFIHHGLWCVLRSL